MVKRFLFLVPIILMASDLKTPEEIQEELNVAEAQFKHAKKLFNPWYTGPLITPSASMIPPGYVMTQPYVYVADNYAMFDKQRKSISLPSNLVSVKLLPFFYQIGVTKTVDVSIFGSGVMNWQSGQFGGGFNDVTAILGFLVQPESLYVPQVKFTISETFPTGKYQNLSTNGLNLNASGAGAFATQFGFVFSKVLFWARLHPLNARAFIGYTLSTPVHVKNFNAYGGGFGTRGTVHPGNSLAADLGLELSMNQRWALALDLVYTANNRTTFHGNPGRLASGKSASVGTGYSDNFSLCPAIEYNWADWGGFIGGAWFSVYGRNSLNFAQAVLSAYMVLPPD